jgi:hypothetical protein
MPARSGFRESFGQIIVIEREGKGRGKGVAVFGGGEGICAKLVLDPTRVSLTLDAGARRSISCVIAWSLWRRAH